MTNIWKSWQAFRLGKHNSSAILLFQAHLESNILRLTLDLHREKYKHGGYKKFIVHDPKRREIAVAGVRDRVVHRLLYDYLVAVWDKSFCYDAWSCRNGKGLLGATNRAKYFSKKYKNGWVWRSDVKKFFDNVNQARLCEIIQSKKPGVIAMRLLNEVISSYNHNSLQSPVSSLQSPVSSLQ